MIWLLFVSFVASLSYSILIESIPSCDELSQICIVSQNGKYQMIIPHYLLTCYSSSEKETLQDLLSDRTVDISEFQSIDFLQHHFFDLHGLSPHVIVLQLFASIFPLFFFPFNFLILLSTFKTTEYS